MENFSRTSTDGLKGRGQGTFEEGKEKEIETAIQAPAPQKSTGPKRAQGKALPPPSRRIMIIGKRGRPKSNGHIPARKFFRVPLVLNAYEALKAAGTKHASAVTETITQLRQSHPDVQISETTVKRILAKWRPAGYRNSLHVREMTETEIQYMQKLLELVGIPPGRNGVGFALGIGRRPTYERINSKRR
jgi:hypothetical protein